ncbi:MAG TPA: extracellular solute-binding protein [Candidatus Acidoferrales bacterium]|nr:extracellular solute-binding protein [Candidatus Acidoferrales bacterium]
MAPAAAQPAAVSVLYAGSLVTPMEGPIKADLHRQGVDFQGEPGGSAKLANFILAGVRSPDVFIAVDPTLLAKLGSRVASSTTFASTTLGVAWSPKSRYAPLFARVAAGAESLAKALATPNLKIGRTDPRLDPKGRYTVASMNAWLGTGPAVAILGVSENPAQIFPEEDLLARVDTGEADVGFFYKTEAVARGFPFVPLPPEAAAAARIEYALAIMRDAPHPQQARTFANFVLRGAGRAILERAGLTYLTAAGNP